MTVIDRETVNKIFFEPDIELKNRDFSLPIRWDGKDFYKELYLLLKDYRDRIEKTLKIADINRQNQIKIICQWVCLAVSESIHGNPNKAYEAVDKALTFLTQNHPCFVTENDLHKAPLYRAVDVKDRATHDRKRVFHVPFDKRSKMNTTRYSIPGYPSLYLGTSLELNCIEIGKDPYHENVMAARFEYHSDSADSQGIIEYQYQKPVILLDLGVKPQDYKTTEENDQPARRDILTKEKDHLYHKPESYLFWYPLIAACSFIRAFRDDPFSAEYIVPQLVTQWAKKTELSEISLDLHKPPLLGVRYFSCVSDRASEMGLNYAFPSSGNDIWLFDDIKNFCPVLAANIKLTTPVFISESESIHKCEEALQKAEELERIGNFDTEKIVKKIIEEQEKDGKYSVPDGEDIIPDFTFDLRNELKYIHIPDSVTSIGAFAFCNCSELTEIHIPDSVTSIGDDAFCGCSKLPKIDIPDSVTSIGNGAFSNCSELTEIHIPDSVTSIGDYAFFDCSELTEIHIPDSVTSIGDYAFFGCSKLTEIHIPDSVISIGEGAFYYCSELTDVTIPNSVISIGEVAFSGCKKLHLRVPRKFESKKHLGFEECAEVIYY
ncbi:MAG: leucine-rich repeat domain-containing protein [Lachnospiraceae bacterium]|nr:leucine-rich repeat domain-containing protein [Lachnospiraceae bacterium]